ncbi:hypothetical protein LX36DRAFT_673806 [Colletotrichum falcatum]|nr:hypothetical protein LX36DRAFT_673806 [Colletotrichum falcatum]
MSSSVWMRGKVHHASSALVYRLNGQELDAQADIHPRPVHHPYTMPESKFRRARVCKPASGARCLPVSAQSVFTRLSRLSPLGRAGANHWALDASKKPTAAAASGGSQKARPGCGRLTGPKSAKVGLTGSYCKTDTTSRAVGQSREGTRDGEGDEPDGLARSGAAVPMRCQAMRTILRCGSGPDEAESHSTG